MVPACLQAGLLDRAGAGDPRNWRASTDSEGWDLHHLSLPSTTLTRVTFKLGGKIAHSMQDPGDADSGFGRLVHDDEALHHNEVAESVTGRTQLVAQMSDRRDVGKDVQYALEVGAQAAGLNGYRIVQRYGR